MIRGKKIHVQKPTFDIHAGIHNRFDVEVRDAVSGKIRQRALAFNVILNQFWNRATNSDNFSNIWYGNGSGVPTENDTGMFGTAYHVSATADSTGADWDTGVFYRRKKITLSETTAVGVNISEVGVGTASVLCTHALLQDMNGNPITILKTNTDIITIYATVYAHWDVDGYDNGKIWFTESIASSLSDLQVKTTHGFYVYSSDEKPLNTISSSASFSTTTRKLTFPTIRIPVGSNNNAGLRYIGGNVYFSLAGTYQILGEPVGTGDGSTVDYAFKFDIPSSVTIYVDGNAVTSGYTVYSQPKYKPNAYFLQISEHSRQGRIIQNGAPFGNDGGFYYNPYYSLGLKTLKIERTSTSSPYVSCSISDDMENWVSLANRQSLSLTITIPEEYQHYRFIQLTGTNEYFHITDSTWPDAVSRNGKMLHFDVPPTSGAVITADYTTPFVPKDANHVFDFSCTISFGNYEGDT